MQRNHFYKGWRLLHGNRGAGDRRKEILDTSSFPRHVGREMIDGQRMRIDLAEQAADWRDDCTKPVRTLPVNGALRAALVWPKPSQNGTAQMWRNGTRREPIVPQTWYRRHPHSPSWL